LIQSARLIRRFLIQADYVAGGITKPRGSFGGIATDRLHDHATACDYGVDSVGNTIDHYVNQEAGLSHRRSAEHPCATHFAN
jgi:hypothetical protein